jgi:ABC-type transport system involved in cytochrome c biogenesis ATPase subunit
VIQKVIFKKDYRKVFLTGDIFIIEPGINLLVGDQGCGKSSLLHLLREKSRKPELEIIDVEASIIPVMSFDFERDNLRNIGRIHETLATVQVTMNFLSHGECNKAVLSELKKNKNTAFLMDEPDMALSIRSCKALVDNFKFAIDNGCQIIAAVHNPIIIKAFPFVLSLEHKCWMSSGEFIKSHMEEKCKP